jgi:hypothetical protein
MSGLTIVCAASHFVLEGGVVLMPIQFVDAIGSRMPAAAMSSTVDREIALPWGASTVIAAAATTLEATTLGAAALISASLITLVIIAGAVWLLALLSLVVRIIALSLIVGILLLSMLLSLVALVTSAIAGRGIGLSRITVAWVTRCGALISDLSLEQIHRLLHLVHLGFGGAKEHSGGVIAACMPVTTCWTRFASLRANSESSSAMSVDSRNSR